jgi:hypothetical protein
MPDEELAHLLSQSRKVNDRLSGLEDASLIEVRDRLDGLLDEARGLDWDDGALRVLVHDIVDLLAGHETTRRWMREYHITESAERGSYEPVPGHGRPIPPYACWECPCGYRFPQRSKGQPVPPCPKDGTALTKVNC